MITDIAQSNYRYRKIINDIGKSLRIIDIGNREVSKPYDYGYDYV